jgi:hypothetical protein
MPTVGFLTNAVASNAIDTTYTLADVVALTDTDATAGEVGITTVPGSETPLPQGVYLDHVELRGVQGAAITSINVWFSWDANGDQPLTSEGTIVPVAALTTANLIGGVCVIDAWVRPPGRTLTLYMHVKVNASTLTIPQYGVRLHWAQSFGER